MTSIIELETPDPSEDRPEPLTDERLRMIIQNEIAQSVNHATSQIAQDQERAIKYYEGRPFGNEVEGSSKVVMRDLAETVDWIMPGIMRSLFYTSEIVRYEDTTPASEKAGHGRLMTKVINEIFKEQLDGFRLTFNWGKAGLLEKFATVKCWAEQIREPRIESYGNLTEDDLVSLDDNEDVEIIQQTSRIEIGVDPVTELEVEIRIFNVRIKRWQTHMNLRVETIPPEEFLCTRMATKLDQRITFVAHQSMISKSELHSLGIPWGIVEDLPVSSTKIDRDGRATVRRDNENLTLTSGNDRADEASKQVQVTESYILVDYDGDGYAERRRVLTAGEDTQEILENDYIPMHGMAGWTPIPMPHKLYGRDYYDVMKDIVEIRSTVARQLLDNIYRMNNARHKVVIEAVDLDSYLDTAPGAPVLVENMDAIEPLAVPALPNWAFEALNYFEKVGERRTGVHPYTQEVYAAGANQTAQGVSQVFEAAMAQIMLLSQHFGNALQDLFRIIPRVMKDAAMGPAQIKIGDEWITYNPQEWPDDIRARVDVGLSPGQTEQRIQRLMMILGLQREAHQATGEGHMVTLEQIYNTAVRVVEEAGFPTGETFFTNPTGKPMPETPPDPGLVKAEAEAADAQAGRALDMAKLEAKERDDSATLRVREEGQNQTHARELERIAMEERSNRYRADKQFEAALIQARAGKDEDDGPSNTESSS